GLVTLLALQAVTGQLRRFRRVSGMINNRAFILMAGDEVIQANLRRTHVSERELVARLRQAGIRHRTEVACVILESTGQISILRSGILIEPRMLEGVAGADLVPASFMAVPSD
ncbi:MAG: DUF421 domain-containing protein, partial [Micrococcaceae bacterium]|nr:DUF421 domain-containing protein [Micrococcaceae bacterium]